jgi:hypothetical protein
MQQQLDYRGRRTGTAANKAYSAVVVVAKAHQRTTGHTADAENSQLCIELSSVSAAAAATAVGTSCRCCHQSAPPRQQLPTFEQHVVQYRGGV